MLARGTEWIGFPADGQGFVRRECPRCQRQFKTPGGPADGAIVQRYLAKHLQLENCHEVTADDVLFHCVYCGCGARADEWCTPQQRAWMERVANALRAQMRFEQLTFAYRTLRDNPGPTFLAVAPPCDLPQLEYEPDDMRRASFFCCVEDVKLDARWRRCVCCPRCGAEHQTSASRYVRLALEPVDA